MGLLDRLKSMVSEMTEEEKKEFFEEMDTGEAPEEPAPEAEELPDQIECTTEDLAGIISVRDEMLSLKITFADICLEHDRQKEQMLEAMEAKQEELMKEVESIKEKYIADPKAREEYLLNIDPSLEDPSFLLRQSDSSPE